MLSRFGAQALLALPIAAYICDGSGFIVHYNDRARELWGGDPPSGTRYCFSSEAFEKGDRRITPQESSVSRALEGHEVRDREVYLLREDHSLVHLIVNASALRDADGNIHGALCTLQDVTDLAEKQHIFETIFDQTSIGMILINADGTVRECNPFFAHLLGIDRNKAIGKAYLSVLVPDDRRNSESLHADLISGKVETARTIRRLRRRNGSTVPVRVVSARTTDSRNRPTVVSLVYDISTEYEQKLKLRQTQKVISGISDSGLLGMGTFRLSDGVLTDCNEAWVNLIGYSTEDISSGRFSWRDFTAPEYHHAQIQALDEVRARGTSKPFEKVNIRKDGRRVTVVASFARLEESGDCIGWVLDISRLRELEQHLAHSSKMEAIGELAGGIAHDFNNLLMVITAQAELLGISGDRTPKETLMLNRIAQSVEKAKQLTGKLLAFSRRQELTISQFDLSEAVQESVDLVRISLPNHIQLNHVSSGRWEVSADRVHIEQAVMNLLLNARDAMPDGGRIDIGTEMVRVTEAERGLHDTVPPGDYAVIRVADTGVGIPPVNLPRIFEPFFTTKPKGQGTGLGLAVVYGMIKQSGGFVRVQSALNTGTTFYLYLPVFSVSASLADVKRRGIIARLLLVEDQPELGAAVASILSADGYSVEVAINAEEALQKFATESRPFDLLITDLHMPGRSGVELAKRLRQSQPRLPIVLMSGYAAASTAAEDMQGVAFLQKPVSRAKLLSTISDALEAGSQSPRPN